MCVTAKCIGHESCEGRVHRCPLVRVLYVAALPSILSPPVYLDDSIFFFLFSFLLFILEAPTGCGDSIFCVFSVSFSDWRDQTDIAAMSCRYR